MKQTANDVALMDTVEANYCFKHNIKHSELKKHPEATAELIREYIRRKGKM